MKLNREIDPVLLKRIEDRKESTTTELSEFLTREGIQCSWSTLCSHIQKLVLNLKIVRAEKIGEINEKPYYRDVLRGGLLLSPEYYRKHSNGNIYAEEIAKVLCKKLRADLERKQKEIDRLLTEKFGDYKDLGSKILLLEDEREKDRELILNQQKLIEKLQSKTIIRTA